jgi:hypothetical protein
VPHRAAVVPKTRSSPFKGNVRIERFCGSLPPAFGRKASSVNHQRLRGLRDRPMDAFTALCHSIESEIFLNERKTTSRDKKSTSRFAGSLPSVNRVNGPFFASTLRQRLTRGKGESDSDQVPKYRKDDLHGLLNGSANFRGFPDRGDGSHPMPGVPPGAFVVQAGCPL